MEAVKKPEFRKEDTTKEKLIRATQYLLACYGYEMATTREITRIAGTSLSAISFHFGTKEALVKAAVDYTADNLNREIDTLACECTYHESGNREINSKFR